MNKLSITLAVLASLSLGSYAMAADKQTAPATPTTQGSSPAPATTATTKKCTKGNSKKCKKTSYKNQVGKKTASIAPKTGTTK